MAENVEEFGARFTIDVSNLKNGITQANRYIKNAESEFKAAAAGMDDWRTSEEGLEAKLKSLGQVSDAQEAKVQALRAEYQRVSSEMGETSAQAINLSTRLNNATADFNRTQKEIRETSQRLDDLRNGANDAGNAMSDISSGADDAAGAMGGLGGSIIDVVKQVGPLAAAAVGIGAFADYAMESSDATARLNAALGVTGDKAAEFDQALENIYAGNYGESFDDIAESATEVAKVLGNDISADTLESVTKQALILRDTFGSDVNESVKAADALMKNFGMTSDEAFDMMAKGAQSGLDKNGEMFDSFTEYSQYFADLGLSAEDMFNGMKAGTDQFLMGADKSMDAWKEFGIRVIDGSSSTAEAMELIGLDADEMAAKFAQGGEVSAAAVQETIKAIQDMDDPVKQSQAGVALFGTQWEDMGESGMQAMFDLMGTAVETKGTMDQIDQTRYDNIGDSLQAIGRTIQTSVIEPIVNGLTPAVSDFAESVIPVIQEGAQWFIDNLPVIAPMLAAIGAGFAVFQVASLIQSASAALAAFKTAQEAATIAQAAMNAVMAMNPFVLIAMAIAAVVTALITLWMTNEDFRNAVIGIWDGISSAIGSAIDGIVGFFTETIPNAFNAVIEFFANNWQSLLLMIVNPFAGAFSLLYNNCEVFREFVDGFIENFITFIGNSVAKIVEFFTVTVPNGITAMLNVFAQLPSRVWTFLSNLLYNVAAWERQMITNAIETGSSFLSNVVNFISQLPSSVWSFLSNVISDAASFARQLASSAANAGSSFLNNVISFVSQVPSNVWSIISQIPGQVSDWAGDMVGAGANLIDGLVSGIWDGADAVVGAIRDICANSLDAVKSFFGISSPSKLMMEMGGYIDKGLTLGLAAGLDDVAEMSDKLAEAATPNVDGSSFGFGSNGGKRSTIPSEAKTVSVVQNFYSPEAITAKDAYRQGRKLQQTLAAGV